jgi:toxin ParE1/3/4
MAYRLLPKASADIEDIVFYIAKDNPSAALTLLDVIHAQCRRLNDLPNIGVLRSDIHPDLRLSVVGNYLILYRQVGCDIEIVRVLHGARQWQDLIEL